MKATSISGSAVKDPDQVIGDLFHKIIISPDTSSASGSSESIASLEEELALYRLILTRLRTADASCRDDLSFKLTTLIVRDCGLRKIFSATFDFDESSQQVTTLDQRFQAMANIIVSAPKLCCTMEQYFRNLSSQIHAIMCEEGKVADAILMSVRKLCSLVVNAMLIRKRQLAIHSFVQPLISALVPPGNNLTPLQAIQVIFGLVNSDFESSLLLKAFPSILYVCCELESSPSSHKVMISSIIVEFLKQIDNSVYLMDDALFNHCKDYARLYSAVIEESGKTSIEFRERTKDMQSVDLDKMQNVASVSLQLASDGFSEEKIVDFCLLLLERLAIHHIMTPECAFLLYTLIAKLLVKVEPFLCKYPRKWIGFVTQTLERLNLTNREDHRSTDPDQSAAFSLAIDSIGIVAQIIRTLVLERGKLCTEDVESLRCCLSNIKRNQSSTIIEVDDLLQELEDLKSADSSVEPFSDSKKIFEEAMKDLNDPLMPSRAHGLITLKRLIEAGDPIAINSWKRLLKPLEISLADSESYIYLSAINTLAALSLTKADEALPFLMLAFTSKERTIQERLNVGEVIARVSRNLGTDAAKYCPLFFETFFNGLQSSEDELIRISSLSNMGFFCSQLGPDIKPYIPELLHSVETLISSDPPASVKRACLMLLHLTLTGIDGKSFEVIRQKGSRLHSLILAVCKEDSDDVSRIHAQLALEELDRIALHRLSLTEDDG